MSCNIKTRCLFTTVMVMLLLVASNARGEISDHTLFQKGRQLIRDRKWTLAEQTFFELVESGYTGPFLDDARFWIGFSQEQMNRSEDAFKSFQYIIEQYETSPWMDDAAVHQIQMARQLSASGGKKYIPFLIEKLSSPDTTLQQHAAIALGELRRPEALNLLEKMASSSDSMFRDRAIDLLKGYEENLDETVSDSAYASGLARDEIKDLSVKEAIKKHLGNPDGQWTPDELILFGLYHIVPEKDLAFYLSLENQWDRKEWWRKQWALMDPTPTTPQNEALTEFLHRVFYARKHFACDNVYDNNLRLPWDRRGEVYIKIGPPDSRSPQPHDWEEWTYYEHRLVLKVPGYRHSRSGNNNIYLSSVSKFLFRNGWGKKAYIIQKPFFYYKNPFDEPGRKIKNGELSLDVVRQKNDQIILNANLRFPAKSLRYEPIEEGFITNFQIKWVLFDADMNEVLSSQFMRSFRFKDSKELKKTKSEVPISLQIKPGAYRFALNLMDLNSDKVSTFIKPFNVYPKATQE